MTTLETRERAGDRAARRATGQGTPEDNAGPKWAGVMLHATRWPWFDVLSDET